jgi:UDP-glucose 4-epimerase
MTILVTGGAGYIGSHMVLALKDAGQDVVVLDNLSTGSSTSIPDGVPLVVGDMGDAVLVAQTIKTHNVEAIIHFAAKIVVPESVAHPLDYYENNTAKSRTLIDTALKNGVKKIIFSSTAAVYGEPTTIPVTEETPQIPVNPYGRSKLMTEWMLHDAAHAHGLRFVVLRYFNVAGADPQGRAGQSTPNATHLIKVACETVVGKRDKMMVFGTDYPTPDGTCIRDYIHVSDLVGAHLTALTHLNAGGDSGTFNCGYGTGYSVQDIVQTMKKVSSTDFQVDYAPRRAGDPAVIVADSTRIKQVLNWSPRYNNIELILSHALAWEKKTLQKQPSI